MMMLAGKKDKRRQGLSVENAHFAKSFTRFPARKKSVIGLQTDFLDVMSSNPSLFRIELKFWKIIMPAVDVLAGIIRKMTVLSL